MIPPLRNSEAFFVGVNVVHERFEVVAVLEVGLFQAHFKAGAGGGIVGERAAEDILPVRLFFRGSFLHVLADPVTDLAVGDGLADGFDEILMLHTGGFEPHAIKTLAEILGVIGMQFAGEMEPDLVQIAGQKMPAVHGFAGAAGIDEFTHGMKDAVG